MAVTQSFSVAEMWQVSQRNNSQWGIEGYDVPRKHLDARAIKRQKELAELKPGKYLASNKTATRRGHYLEGLLKSQTVEYHKLGTAQKYKPGPARYYARKTFKEELKAQGSKAQKPLDMTT
jgi:hypothetical protein